MDDQVKSPSKAGAFVANQKNFLHDIASPISVSQGMIDIVLSHLKGQAADNKGDIEKLEKAARAIEKIATLIDLNRNYLTSEVAEEMIRMGSN